MPDTIDGTIQEMRDRDPQVEIFQDGEIWRSRENSEPTRESIFAWDPTPYDGPLYERPGFPPEVPQYIGFAPDISGLEDGSQGVWRWVDPPRGSIDAERVYGISAKTSANDNGKYLQRCIDEALGADSIKTLLLPSGDINLGSPVHFNIYIDQGGTPTLVDGGGLIVQGHGTRGASAHPEGGHPATRLIYTGTNHNVNVFLIGDENRALGGELGPTGIKLRDVTLIGTTNEDFAILRMWSGRSAHHLQNVLVEQRGEGNGLDATDTYLSVFTQVVCVKSTEEEDEEYTGRGFWLHTEEHPVFVSGEISLTRISAFGQWEQGIVLGENTSSKFFGGVSASFLNAESCFEGIVIGRGAANVDISVAWVEVNQQCGIRIYNGATDVYLRRVYAFHSAPCVPNTFEGDVVLGKKGTNGTALKHWNRYEGIRVDGVYQHFIWGPAVRVYNVPDELVRDIIVRDIRAGKQFSYDPADPPCGPAIGGGAIEVVVKPFTDALVKLDDHEYDGLTVHNARPHVDHGLPDNTSGNIVQLVNYPARVDRLFYSGPFKAPLSHGVYELRRPTVARRDLYHEANYQIEANDPMYHRVSAKSAPLTITLPNVSNQSGVIVEDRIGLEFHVMKVGGSNNVLVQGASGQEIRGHLQGAATDVSLNNEYEYVRVRSISENGTLFWEIVNRSS